MKIKHCEFQYPITQLAQRQNYSLRRHSGRKKTRNAFLSSLIIHAIVLGLLSFSYVKWYKPMLPSEPLVSEAITVTELQRFHITSFRKRSMPAARRSRPTAPAARATAAPMRPMEAAHSITARTAMPSTQTAARLPMTETSIDTLNAELKPLATADIKPEQLVSSNLLNVLKTQEPSKMTQQTGTAESKPFLGLIDRDAHIGEALEGIAESIADGTSEPVAVDTVFLLDISGSMIDNIRAVGRQLTRMVEVFEEKNVDFTLGIVIFRYLEGDTIIHPQTKDAERYKRLLTSHVVAAAGDERAHNAIMKTIRRVNFREGANRRFILVTDEPSKGSYSLSEVLVQCLKQKIVVDVIGINDTSHKALTVKTGGLWFPIPKQE